jgi:serine/threonine protein kinase
MTGGVGTPQYMAPELMQCATLERTQATKAVDVFSFGILLLVIRTKKPPYANLTNFDIIDGIRNHGLRPVIPEASGIKGTQLEGLIVDCMKELPAERPSFKQVIARLGDSELMVDHTIGDGGDDGDDGEQEEEEEDGDGWQSCDGGDEEDEGIYASVSMPHLAVLNPGEEEEAKAEGAADPNKGRSYPDFASAIAAGKGGKGKREEGSTSEGTLFYSNNSEGWAEGNGLPRDLGRASDEGAANAARDNVQADSAVPPGVVIPRIVAER